MRVCRNALRPSLRPGGAIGRKRIRAATIQLGVAARLFPVKGVALALHAVRPLRARGLDVELRSPAQDRSSSALAALARSSA